MKKIIIYLKKGVCLFFIFLGVYLQGCDKAPKQENSTNAIDKNLNDMKIHLDYGFYNPFARNPLSVEIESSEITITPEGIFTKKIELLFKNKEKQTKYYEYKLSPAEKDKLYERIRKLDLNAVKKCIDSMPRLTDAGAQIFRMTQLNGKVEKEIYINDLLRQGLDESEPIIKDAISNLGDDREFLIKECREFFDIIGYINNFNGSLN